MVKPLQQKKPSVPGFNVKAFLSSVGNGRSEVAYQPKDVLFHQGDRADMIYYIEKGSVQITVVSDQGKEGVIGLLNEGDFAGEGCLAGQEFYMASASAIKPTNALKISKPSMLRALHDQTEMSGTFTAFLLSRNIQLESDLVDQLFNSSEKRLARALLQLANFDKDGKMEAVVPKISQETLAARVGTTRARVNFFMNKFRKLGLIEYNGELKVRSALINIIVND